MNRSSWTCGIALSMALAGLGTGCAGPSPRSAADPFERALSEASETRRLVLLTFTIDTCLASMRAKRIIESEVAQLPHRDRVVSVNLEIRSGNPDEGERNLRIFKDLALAAGLAADPWLVLPAYFIVRPDGSLVTAFRGQMDADALATFLERGLRRA